MVLSSRVVSASEWESARTLPPDHVPNVFRIDGITVAKTGLDEAQAKSEVAAMNLARSQTTMPVPEVYNCYQVEDTQKWCIVMEFVEGEVLQEVWKESTTEWKNNIIQQLKGFMEELHALKGQFIGTVDGAACQDQFFEDQEVPYGPFAAESDFHSALIEVMRHAQNNAWVELVAGFIRSLPTHDIVLTHSDFAPRNIIVRGDKVVAILDWELSGYYPAYWEYVKAYYLPDWESEWVQERAFDRVMKPYPIEHAVLIHASRIMW